MNLGSTGQEEAIGTKMATSGKSGDEGGVLTAEIKGQWSRVRTKLRGEYGDAVYNNWFKPMTLLRVVDDRVEIGVPSQFSRDWFEQHYRDRIRALWHEENRKVVSVAFAVIAGLAAVADDAEIAAPAVAAPGRDILDGDDRGMISPLDPRFTFENFVVGKPNEFAHAAAKRLAEAAVAESLQPPFNPLFLHGGVGLGKTHLMHAIAWEMRRYRPNRRFIYLSAEKFMYRFVLA
ncbi:MAG: DnaA ATPase domain-containing protein, partial [Stellaceae bacterium]